MSETLNCLMVIGVFATPWPPWMGQDFDHPVTELAKTKAPWESIHGCNLLRWIISSQAEAIRADCAGGSTTAATYDNGRPVTVTLVGSMDNHLTEIYDDEQAIFLRARVFVGSVQVTLIGTTLRISGAKIPKDPDADPLAILVSRVNTLVHLFLRIDQEYKRYSRAFLMTLPEINPVRYLLVDRGQPSLPGHDDDKILIQEEVLDE